MSRNSDSGNESTGSKSSKSSKSSKNPQVTPARGNFEGDHSPRSDSSGRKTNKRITFDDVIGDQGRLSSQPGSPERPATPTPKPDDSHSDASEGFDGMLDVDHRAYLKSYDLSDEQIKAIEGHVHLGMDAAAKLVSKQVEFAETSRRESALRAILVQEKGWTQ